MATQQALDQFRTTVLSMYPGKLRASIGTSRPYLNELKVRLGAEWDHPYPTQDDPIRNTTRVRITHLPTGDTYLFDLEKSGPAARLIEASIRREATSSGVSQSRAGD